MDEAVQHREYYYQKWRKSIGINKLEWWIEHRRAQAILRRLINKRKRHLWRQFCDSMNSLDFSKVAAKIKRIKNSRTIRPSFTHPLGPQHAVNQLATHFQQIYSGHLLDASSRPPPPTAPTPPESSSPFSVSDITSAIKQLAKKKAPGIDSIISEVLQPIHEQLSLLLLPFFSLCWKSGLTPLHWRTAQVIPLHKKGDPSDPANFRPISLTSVFRKILEKCLTKPLRDCTPAFDIAQGGFRPQRSTLDQVLCLTELCRLHLRHHKQPPVLAFLDIKSAYDTVDRQIIWNALAPTTPPSLLRLLQHLFDDVRIEFLLQNHQSPRFSPVTGVLQGSILSPFLYSIYINTLPSLLRHQPYHQLDTTITTITSSINCLLYADDVALIGTPSTIQPLLQLCADHSHHLGYRWNPTKCVVLDPNPPPPTPYGLYGTPLPVHDTFQYLGIPIGKGGTMDAKQLINKNTTKAITSMNILSTIGVNRSGYKRLLATRIYQQFIRPMMEYGLAITITTKQNIKKLESTQATCIRRIYGAHNRSSTRIMRHLTNTPSMTERHHSLQLQYVHRMSYQPTDTLVYTMTTLMDAPRTKPGIWHKLLKQPLASRLPTDDDVYVHIPDIIKTYRQEILDVSHPQFALLQQCRPVNKVDPILLIPMLPRIRSRCIRWRLGWLTGGTPKPCHCGTTITKKHILQCRHFHSRLSISFPTASDPLSFLLNRLPSQPPRSRLTISRWKRSWPIICALLLEMEYLQHPDHIEPTNDTDQDPFITWINRLALPRPPPSPLLPLP
ncbi:unnamed protein product [Absidia cylindrospora]